MATPYVATDVPVGPEIAIRLVSAKRVPVETALKVTDAIHFGDRGPSLAALA